MASGTFIILSLLLHAIIVGSSDSTPNPAGPAPPSPFMCPLNAAQLGICLDVLFLIKINVGATPSPKCCPVIAGLLDLEAALCLCLPVKANLLGADLNLPLQIPLLLSSCGRNIPVGFKCPSS